MSQLLAGLGDQSQIASAVWKATGNQGAMPPGFLSNLNGGAGGSNFGGGPGNTPPGAMSYSGSSLTPNPYQGKEAA